MARHTSGRRVNAGGRGTPARRPPGAGEGALPPAFLAVAACFFFSGAAALTLEMVWSRSLRLVFGSTTLAISTVLVAYMLGLGLGGLLGAALAARVRRGVRVYGVVEIAVGVYALAVPWMLRRLPALDAWIAGTGFWEATALRFVAVLAILLVPTMLMGATLPVLVAAMVRRDEGLAARVGLLYGINTLGAVAGVLLATFAFFPTLGLGNANLAGAAMAVLVGVLALALVAPRVGGTAQTATPTADAPPVAAEGRRRWDGLLLSYGLVGFTALAYEVCWTRALAMILGSSIYAFATMLAAFLAGIALGSLASRRWWDRVTHPQAVYAAGVGALGLSAVATILALGEMPRVFVRFVDLAGVAPGSILAVNACTALLAMLAPTLVLGALFPLLLRAQSVSGRAAHRLVGEVYFVNTIGCALGAFAAGFLLIPRLGLQTTMAILVALNLAVAALLLVRQRQWTDRRRLPVVALLALGAVVVLASPPRWQPAELNRGVYQLLLDADEWRVEYEPLLGVVSDGMLLYREGINTTVAVERRDGELVLRVNGKPDAGSEGDMPTQVLAGQVPMLFGPHAERILVIGLASGVTVGSLALHRPAEIDVVELEPAMVDASRFFDDLNHRPLEYPGTRVIVEDGRRHLARRPPPYDLIISEPSNPWISGVSNLFTREFFRAARAALRPDGRLLQWVQLYGLPIEAWASILAAMQAEFPYLYVFSNGTTAGDSFILGSQRRLTAPDFPRWEDLSDAVRDDLRRIGTFSTADLWSLLRLGPEEVAEIAAEAPVLNTDDNMYVELTAPFALHDTAAHQAIRRRMERPKAGALPQLESAGLRMSDDDVGELALSYATRRRALSLARAVLGQRPGLDAYALALDGLLLIEAPVNGGRNYNGPKVASVAHPSTVKPVRLRAVSVGPDRAALRWHRATVLHDLQDPRAALRDLDAFLDAAPGNVRARAQRVRMLVDLGRMQEARAEARGLLDTRYVEYDWDLLPIAAMAAARLGDFDVAVAEVRRFLERRPGEAHGWRLLGDVLDELGDHSGARQARENAARTERNASRRMYVNALRYQRAGQTELAVEMLRAVVAGLPGFLPARQALRHLADDGR